MAVGKGTGWFTTTSIAATKLVMTKPAGFNDGDLAVLGIVFDNGSVTVDRPAGWTVAGHASPSSDLALWVYYRLTTECDDLSQVVTWDTSCNASGTVINYTGTGPPFPDGSILVNSGTTSPISNGNPTATNPGWLVSVMASKRNFSLIPTGFTNDGGTQIFPGAPSDTYPLVRSHKVIASSGSTGGFSSISLFPTTSVPWVSILFMVDEGSWPASDCRRRGWYWGTNF